jgi:hypothetical protein
VECRIRQLLWISLVSNLSFSSHLEEQAGISIASHMQQLDGPMQ